MALTELKGLLGDVLINPQYVTAVVEIDDESALIHFASGHSEIIVEAFEDLRSLFSLESP